MRLIWSRKIFHLVEKTRTLFRRVFLSSKTFFGHHMIFFRYQTNACEIVHLEILEM